MMPNQIDVVRHSTLNGLGGNINGLETFDDIHYVTSCFRGNFIPSRVEGFFIHNGQVHIFT